MGIGHTSRLHHLRFGGPFYAKGDVIKYGIVEKNRFLVHIAHQSAQVVHLNVFDVYPVDENATRGHIVKAGKQIDKRGFATARLPHQCNGGTFRDGERYIFEHRAFAVGKRDIAVFDGLIELVSRTGIFGILNVVIGHHYPVDALQGSNTPLNGINGV